MSNKAQNLIFGSSLLHILLDHGLRLQY